MPLRPFPNWLNSMNTGRTIYGIGEALLDVIFKNKQPIGATAGGSTLNAIVSLGRMDYQPFLISEIGNDRIGDIIDDFLLKNGVSDRYLYRREDSRSPLALAFLNENNDAEYEIFKDYAAQTLHEEMPPFTADDIVTFGSFYSINPAFRPQLLKYLQRAKAAGALLVYDPNYRNHHAHKREQMQAALEENFALADVVRGSNEDFQNIYGLQRVEDVAERLHRFSKHIIITANAKGSYVSTPNGAAWYPAVPLQAVSTIGAGDNFNAGIIHGLLAGRIGRKELEGGLSNEQWAGIIASATVFATEVCQLSDNYVAADFKERVDDAVLAYLKLVD